MRRKRLAALSGIVIAAPLLLAAAGTPGAAADQPPTPAPPLPTDHCGPYPGGDTICWGEVPSFDGSPLDFDVTLPTDNSPGPHPLIVMLHGFGNNKHEWESTSNEGDGADKYQWNNHWFAQHGYYVLTYTARGFRDDGITRPDEPNTLPGQAPNCAPGSACLPAGTIRVKNKDVEIKDTQWLAGLTAVAFPGQVDPQRVAVTGGSYGGGESWLQAAQPDWNSFTDRGLPAMRLQVAVPKYPWTDLTYSLTPNGHPGPGAPPDPEYSSSAGSQASGQDPLTAGEGNPFGVGKASYTVALYALGTKQGIFEEGTSPGPQKNGSEPFTMWNTRVLGDAPLGGEPYDVPGRDDLPDGTRTLRHDFSSHHSAYYQQSWAQQAATQRETAVFSISGWTDDLFEPVESFRMFKYLKSLDPRWPVAVGVGDVGHARAQNPAATWQRMNNQAFQFLQANINGSHQQQTTVYSEQTTCAPQDAPNATRPPAMQLTATTPEGLSAGSIEVTYAGTKLLDPESGGVTDPNGPVADPITGGAIEPVGTDTSGCRSAVSPTAGPTAFTGLSEPLPSKRTYVGLGYVDVPYEALGAPALSSAVLATRVWDVAPDGKALLMTRGVYRLDFRGYDPITGTARVPLFGNQWDLDPGHKIRVDLEQSDMPYLKPPAPDATASLRIGSPNPDAPDLGSPRLVLPTRSAGTTPLAGAGI